MMRASLADISFVNACVRRDFPEIDFTELLSEPLHVCLMEGENGAVFAWRGPKIYEMHVFFACRGAEAIELAKQMIARMRHAHGAKLMWALVPVESRNVRMFSRLVGWKSQGVLETRYGPNELFVSENFECLH